MSIFTKTITKLVTVASAAGLAVTPVAAQKAKNPAAEKNLGTKNSEENSNDFSTSSGLVVTVDPKKSLNKQNDKNSAAATDLDSNTTISSANSNSAVAIDLVDERYYPAPLRAASDLREPVDIIKAEHEPTDDSAVISAFLRLYNYQQNRILNCTKAQPGNTDPKADTALKYFFKNYARIVDPAYPEQLSFSAVIQGNLYSAPENGPVLATLVKADGDSLILSQDAAGKAAAEVRTEGMPVRLQPDVAKRLGKCLVNNLRP